MLILFVFIGDSHNFHLHFETALRAGKYSISYLYCKCGISCFYIFFSYLSHI
uniref:Uncharacterized protein n=1 Tax=Anguilla anguilla TaxID=7936 RepID=A0A0E9T7M7_ANGAN